MGKAGPYEIVNAEQGNPIDSMSSSGRIGGGEHKGVI